MNETEFALKNRLFQLINEKENRLGHKITYADISAATGIGMSVLSRWVNNKVERFDASTVIRLCQYFECDLSDLLYIDHNTD
ncbi:MAG: helix-turn-helix transcriptional regulator [Chloroflexi bacterium]|nr:helix-turn-helix transcriptional regulator [Chloroflexota bacterium]